MYKNTFQDVLETEKGAKQKWVLFFETPCRYLTDALNIFVYVSIVFQDYLNDIYEQPSLQKVQKGIPLSTIIKAKSKKWLNLISPITNRERPHLKHMWTIT